MDKSKVCITKAVKLARLGPCNKKQNFLIFDKTDPCYPQPKRKEYYTATPLACANAKAIKVCTGRDLKRMCKPKLCHCPPRKIMGPWACMVLFIGSTMKAGLAAALIYWTYTTGIWGPPTETEQLYINLCKSVCPTVILSDGDAYKKRKKLQEQCPSLKEATCEKDYSVDSDCCKYPPNMDQLFFRWAQLWNSMVIFSFDLMANGPQRFQEFWAWASERYDKLVNGNAVCDEKAKKEEKEKSTKCAKIKKAEK